jgi:ketosteroid isomerase-like protein
MTTRNKEIIRKLNKGFEADDAEAILSCLADRQQIHNDNFVGAPTITIKNEIAEGNFVAVEGRVECKMKDGSIFKAVFHNTYLLENEKVKAMTSYLVPVADKKSS